MIETLYHLDALGTSRAFFLALLIGVGFGFALERAGFGSSRRLAGVFYFTDMAVVKVMFSALITAMLGLSCLVALGWIAMDRIFLMPTVYTAQVVGGLLFGVGFVMGGWCPGTAAVGLAAGRIDALVFLAGAVGGSILFNEVFPQIQGLYTGGDQGVLMVYDTLGMTRSGFVLALTVVAVVAFWLCEWVEQAHSGRSLSQGSPFLKAFSVAVLALAVGLRVLTPAAPATVAEPAGNAGPGADEQAMLTAIEAAADHMEPEELADLLLAGSPDLMVVDVRPPAEFAAFHIRGATNVPLPALAESLVPWKNRGRIVLYSNGMTHPAQARDSLQRQGFANVYLLTDGLTGFRERCLKPVSLRAEPLDETTTARVNAWRQYFSAASVATDRAASVVSRRMDPAQLAAQLGNADVKVLDLRPQPEYNTAHIPGSLSLNVESFRGNVGGVPSVLLPSTLLAAQCSLLGLRPSDTVVLVANDKLHDATLAGMAFDRLGHANVAVLDGGHGRWVQEGYPVNAVLPTVSASAYPARSDADRFTVDGGTVLAELGTPGLVILDVRPADFYVGKKSDEARAGHIPGAINRPYTEDVSTSSNKVTTFKPVEVLAEAYGKLIPAKDTEIIVHCRTGHQASQTFFVLRHLLGYSNVRWYDAGWTEWATRPEWPVVVEAAAAKGKDPK